MKNSGKIKQSDLLFKFLLFATLIFVVLVAIIFWQQREIEIAPVTDEQTIVRFSDRGQSTSFTDTYLYGARYIHDIESHSSINDLFFTANFPQLVDRNKTAEALAEVKEEKATQDEFGKTHVYSTSYYIGNLLVSPNLTLHAILVDGDKPNTSILLDAALADIRSGVVKIQNFYDVAPPYYYDEAYAGATYFSTASFPSLTVAEAGIVLYLLAELDPVNARLYEQFLHQYANQVFASGANFYLDIDYALKLASAYFSIIKESPDYKILLQQAKEEWLDSKNISLENYMQVKFSLDFFPYENNFSILKPKLNLYKNTKSNEQLSGEIMLSLIDKRLPDPVARLYNFKLSDDSLLPFAVDLSPRKYPSLSGAVANFSGTNQDKYFFVSGDKPRASEAGSIFFKKSQVFYRSGNEVFSLTDSSEATKNSIQNNLELSSGQDRLLYNQFLWEQRANPDSWDIKLDKLVQGKLLKSEVIARGSNPVLALSGEVVLFWRDDGVWQVNTNSGSEQKMVTMTPKKEMTHEVNLDYLEETKSLVVSRSYLEPDTLRPKTELLIYRLEKSGDIKLETKKLFELEINDGAVLSVKQSPGGNYLAVLVNETSGGNRPRLLIFDIINGIIKKELDLKPYSNNNMVIDRWLAIE